MKRKVANWMNQKYLEMKIFATQKSEGMGTVEIILIIVVIFTIYKGCK